MFDHCPYRIREKKVKAEWGDSIVMSFGHQLFVQYRSGCNFKVEKKKKVANVSSNMFYYAIVLVIQIR